MSISLEELLLKISNSQEFITNENYDDTVLPIIDAPVKIPVLGKIAAGLPILAVENIDGYEFAPSSFIKDGYDYFYLKVQRR